MSKRVKWFAKPLTDNYKFMAAAKITCYKLKITPMKLLYALVFDPDGKEGNPNSEFSIKESMSKKTVMYIRYYFMEVFNNEKACIDFLNEDISAKYFSEVKFKTLSEVPEYTIDRTNEQAKILMNTVFNKLRYE